MAKKKAASKKAAEKPKRTNRPPKKEKTLNKRREGDDRPQMKSEKSLPTTSFSAMAASTSADPWLICKEYDLHVERVTGNFRFLFEAFEASGQRHSLELNDENDSPDLAQDLFDALQIWPLMNIHFKSRAMPNAAYPQITEIKREHP
jgi:hypothetical protein